MEKGAQLPQIMTVKDRSSGAVKITKIITLGVFFTTVVTVCVFLAARHNSVTSATVQACPVLQDHKLMDKDVRRVKDLRKKDGQILHERFTYDHKSNVAIVQTPGNFSGNSPATLVIDYDRGLVYAYVLDVHECMIFPLRDDLRQLVNTELSTTDGDVVDIAKAVANDNYTLYAVAGQLPDGFVQSFSGPTVDGMCAGRNTYWLEPVDKSDDRNNVRGKRGCKRIIILWGLIIFEDCD